MTVVLFRVDERLVHGQVAAGWARVLQPARMVIINNSIAAQSWEIELIKPAVPEGVCLEVLTVEEAAGRLREYYGNSEKVFILVEDIETVTALVEKGSAIPTLNLGGIYHAEGREEILPYIYLSPDEVDSLLRLRESGIIITVQDVPSTQPADVFTLLRKKKEELK